MYLIDTNVISELRKRGRADRGVIDFFHRAAEEHAGLYLSVVTVAELRRGVELIRHRGDLPQAGRLEDWLDGMLRDYSQNILGVDEEIGQLWGRLRVPGAEQALDKLIAATALIHDLIVVTRNVADFKGTGARVLNPFVA